MEIFKEIISWTHIISATLSLIFGAVVLFGKKGDIKHRKIGLYYFYAMLINNLTALVILNAIGKWFFPHWLAVACLIVIIPGILAIKLKWTKHWLKIHIICLVISYYLLIGGAINEAFLHIESLRPHIINNDPIVRITHIISQFVFIGLLIYYLRKYKEN
ncbi:DUF2306 domain-containing protein [Tenacibaculum piscium]|uniref:Transmembrane protein n=1 Tax=Tenacibaculum piscium TaxID=1458515 RepID=A0A2H1YHB3_9FLAO|nr:DUF2306 domain-containing protein [Tenacibaculum piscium]MBE7629026.1 DUF2306 domain-containing protein [Tenacibaculum piscium]MBE7670470.1 DUF2306 domain-containing protein [Tenacibaculum piscium]MBE7684953.1 DUF2306 domain-containing protein [Tenacibaculum piscium]MBE7689656.1 DUF2306 domain-containing protein [Tenacibaculum piscium]SOS74187.1 conserved membrane hypothetical protein. Putative cation efflux system protein [Tenacibaculum piscium]